MNTLIFKKGYKAKSREKWVWGATFMAFVIFLIYLPTFVHVSYSQEITGCVPPESMDYQGFEEENFDHLSNIEIQDNKLVLLTGQLTIDPQNIVIPTTQEVFVYYISEGAGYKSNFGWALKDQVDQFNRGDPEITPQEFADMMNAGILHLIYKRILDDRDTDGTFRGCCWGGDGVFDFFNPVSSYTEEDVANYDDGTGMPFRPNYDGVVDVRDMRKSLGVIAGGTELLFFIMANESVSDVYWNKIEYNSDFLASHCNNCGRQNYIHYLNFWEPGEGWACTKGWLGSKALDRLSDIFGVTFKEGDRFGIDLTKCQQKYPHLIVAIPQEDPTAQVFAWEDLRGGGDLDMNDLVFMIQRSTEGVAESVVIDSIPVGNQDTTITAVDLGVVEIHPCGQCLGKTSVDWYLSIDGGETWEQVQDWDYQDPADLENPTCDIPGNPDMFRVTKRVRVDFAALNKVGNDLKWKAVLRSEDEDCVVQVEDVNITYHATANAVFSRSSPVVLANVLYSGGYETPAPSWIAEGGLRGHVYAVRIYDPANPTNAQESDIIDLWDAGEVLQNTHPDSRKIKFPDLDVVAVTDEDIATGDGVQRTFIGTFSHDMIMPATVTITDGTETFTETGDGNLQGSLGGTGSYNRFTGEFTVTFHNPPLNNVDVTASYRYYTWSENLLEFNETNVTEDILGLDDSSYIDGTGQHYYWDIEQDDDYDDWDRKTLIKWIRGYRKEPTAQPTYSNYNITNGWKLGPVDHSVPAVIGPPGEPEWFNGSAISDSERVEFVEWRNLPEIANRKTMLYVGSRDGMLHAFYAGEFRHGDNKQDEDPSDPCSASVPTGIEEHRGYFKWDTEYGPCAPNYGTGEERWAFIPSNILPKLKNNYKGAGDMGYVDASPAAADVKINGEWRTVLVCAQGNGGDTVFALDVTNGYDPDSVKFLWEFSDPLLYRSKSSPSIGRIRVNGQDIFAAFFTSGTNRDPNSHGSVFVVDVATGKLVKRIELKTGISSEDEQTKGNSPSGTPSIVDGDRDGFVDRFYVGDDKGRMYRVNLYENGSDDPDDWKVCVLADVGQPIYASPAILENSEDDVEVFFGTGDSPTLEDADESTRYHFYAFRDTADNDHCAAGTMVWDFELPPGHRIWASAFAAASRIYFGTTTTETEDPCAVSEEEGGGRIFALDRNEGTVAMNLQVGNVLSSPIVEDEHLFVKPSASGEWPEKKGITIIGDNQYNNPRLGGQRVGIKAWREVLP